VEAREERTTHSSNFSILTKIIFLNFLKIIYIYVYTHTHIHVYMYTCWQYYCLGSGKFSATWATPPALFAFSCRMGSHVSSWVGPDLSPQPIAFWAAGMVGTLTSWDGGSLAFSPRLASNFNPPNLFLPMSRDYRCWEAMAKLLYFF
jgi:hypothetical protein